jgi:endonuclease-3 related protein
VRLFQHQDTAAQEFSRFDPGPNRGSLKRMFADDFAELRAILLGVNGIGPETADSILLYAAEKRFFVVDAYTKRILGKHGLISNNADYHEVQGLFIENLPKDTRL